MGAGPMVIHVVIHCDNNDDLLTVYTLDYS